MSLLSQFLPSTGGLKSFQTGFVSVASSEGSGEDLLFTEVTLSPVVASKTVTGFQGSGGTSTSAALYSSISVENTGIVTARMTSSTNLRLAVSQSVAAFIRGRWQAAEAN